MGQPTIYRALALLQGVLRRAVEWRRIGHNPVKAVQKPKVRRQREVRPLSPLNVEQLRSVAAKRRKHGARDAALISLLAYAGLRPQEALALRWGDVRELTLLVEKAADGQGGVKATKTGQARTVRLLAPLTTWPSGGARSIKPTTRCCSRAAQAETGTTRPGRPGTGTPGCPLVALSAWRALVPMTCGTASSRC